MATRINITLACTVCQSRNYKTTRTGTPSPTPLELKKYCKQCRTHTVHRETK